jgi:hypothetical protein
MKMNISLCFSRRWLSPSSLLCAAFCAAVLCAQSAENLVPLNLKLPAPAFKGTPKDIQLSSYVEPLSDKPRAPMMVPAGLKNLAPGAKITCSDKNAAADALAKIVDGDKEASEQSIIYLRKGTQWVQMDFGSPQEIFAIVIWHAHNSAKVYHDIVVQAADDQDFIENVRTIFNNDQDNTSGLGVGTDREYFETHEGKLIDAPSMSTLKLRCTGVPLNDLNCRAPQFGARAGDPGRDSRREEQCTMTP